MGPQQKDAAPSLFQMRLPTDSSPFQKLPCGMIPGSQEAVEIIQRGPRFP